LVHYSGINYRHLGRVCRCSSSQLLKRIILTICVVRVLKNKCRKQFRDAISSQGVSSIVSLSEQPYKDVVVIIIMTFLILERIVLQLSFGHQRLTREGLKQF